MPRRYLQSSGLHLQSLGSHRCSLYWFRRCHSQACTSAGVCLRPARRGNRKSAACGWKNLSMECCYLRPQLQTDRTIHMAAALSNLAIMQAQVAWQTAESLCCHCQPYPAGYRERNTAYGMPDAHGWNTQGFHPEDFQRGNRQGGSFNPDVHPDVMQPGPRGRSNYDDMFS